MFQSRLLMQVILYENYAESYETCFPPPSFSSRCCLPTNCCLVPLRTRRVLGPSSEVMHFKHCCAVNVPVKRTIDHLPSKKNLSFKSLCSPVPKLTGSRRKKKCVQVESMMNMFIIVTGERFAFLSPLFFPLWTKPSFLKKPGRKALK